MRRRPSVGLLLVHRIRRWPNSKPTLAQRLMFAGQWATLTISMPLFVELHITHSFIIYRLHCIEPSKVKIHTNDYPGLKVSNN